MDVLTLLKNDHKMVGDMLDKAQKCEPEDDRLVELASQIEQALTVHATIEEKFFYPQLRDRAQEQEERVDVFEAFTEHDVLKHLIALLKSGRKRDEQFKAELQVLGENVKHHVKEEESTIFSLAREIMDQDELNDLGEKMEAAKKRMMARAASGPSSGAKRKAPARKKTSRKAPAKKAARKAAAARKRR